MNLPNIEFMMNMTREYLKGSLDGVTYTLDFPYELENGTKKWNRKMKNTVS